MAVASMPSFVLDCPDPASLARFYGAVLDWRAEADPAGHPFCLCVS